MTQTLHSDVHSFGLYCSINNPSLLRGLRTFKGVMDDDHLRSAVVCPGPVLSLSSVATELWLLSACSRTQQPWYTRPPCTSVGLMD